MALARTNKLGQASGYIFSADGWTSSSFTPSNDSLLVAIFGVYVNATTDPTDLETITDTAGLTWTRRSQIVYAPGSANAIASWVYTAPVATWASMTISLDVGALAISEYVLFVLEYTGHDAASPIGATASDTTSLWTDGPAAITLSAAPASTSEVIGVLTRRIDNASDSVPGTGWTQQYQLGSQFVSRHQAITRTGSTSTSVDWDDMGDATETYAAIAHAVEIKEAGGDPEPTPVGADLSTAWHVREAVAQTQSAAWNVRAAVGQAQASAWHTRAAIGASADADWRARAAVGVEVDAAWMVRAAVAATQAAAWHTRAAIGQEQASAWRVRETVGAELDTTWNVAGALAAVGADLATAWAVRAAVGAEVDASWHVRAVIGQEQALAWAVRVAVGQEQAAAWRVYAVVGADLSAAWHVDGPFAVVGADLSIAWRVLVSEVPPAWGVVGAVPSPPTWGRTGAAAPAVPTWGASETTPAAAPTWRAS